MLPGLSRLEFQELMLSVGKTARARRPLSPVEVGALCAKAIENGAAPKDITKALKMTDVSMISKFISLKKLIPEIRYLVSWGFSGDVAVGFSVAAQLARMKERDQSVVAEAILKFRLTRNEMISVIQLLERSGDTVQDCIDRVVRRRPTIRIQQIVLGAVTSTASIAKLRTLPQLCRDDLLQRIVNRLYPLAKDYTAKLGADCFTIIGGRSVAETIAADSHLEKSINDGLEECLA